MHPQPSAPDWRQIQIAQVNSSLSKLSQISSQLDWLTSSMTHLDSMAVSLPSKFKELRGNGFIHRVSAEVKLNNLVTGWNQVRAGLSPQIESLRQKLDTQISPLRDQGQRIMNRMNQPLVTEYAIRSEISTFDAAVNIVNMTASNQLNQLTENFGTLREDFGGIEEIVADAENAVNSITSASFPLIEREHPILCLNVKKHEPGEKNEGRLFVTDQRLLYEKEKEVVLEKKWFVVTKKKMDRVLDLEVPFGLITEAHKGRVGFVAWDGVYVEIKPGQKFKQAIFDTHGEDTEKLVGAIDYVVSGQADKDRFLTEAIEKPPEGTKAFFCIKCGAPLNVPTIRGIAEVNCIYCGTKNKIQ